MAIIQPNRWRQRAAARRVAPPEQDCCKAPVRPAGRSMRNNPRLYLYGMALPLLLLGGVGAAYWPARFSSPAPAPAAASQEPATPAAWTGLRDGLRAAQPAEAPTSVPEYLNDISVTIHTSDGEGSGVLKRTKDGTTWVWTAGHVVSGLRKTRLAIDPKTGATKTVV